MDKKSRRKKHNKLSLNCGCDACTNKSSVQLPVQLPAQLPVQSSSDDSMDEEFVTTPWKTATKRNSLSAVPRQELAGTSLNSASTTIRSTTTSPYNFSAVSHKTVPETTNRKRTVSSASVDSSDESSLKPIDGKKSRSKGKPPDPESDSYYEPKSKGNQPQPSTSSAAAEKSKPLAKKPKPSPQSASNDGVYQATIRLVDVEVSFLGNKFKKQEKRFVCPFKDCRADFSSWLNLQNHFQKNHKRNDLQKPVVDNAQNWRKIQNENSRYTMSTVKLKLRSLLFDDKLVVDDELKRQREQVNQQIVSVLEQKSIELSKLTILFTSLAYFKVYDIMKTTGNDNDVDEIFSNEVNWKSVLLKLKTFKRNTSNSGLSKATAKRLPKNGVSTFEKIDDDAFFALCKELNVSTAFEEWSQNAWNTIVDTFRTNFRTNIMTHLHQRLRNWFYFILCDGKKNKGVRGNTFSIRINALSQRWCNTT